MDTTTKNTIETLNGLLEINNDRIEGYNRASKETDESDLKNLFSQLADTSHICKQELITEIQKLGGSPAEGTRTSGKVYRVWMDIKAAITNKDIKAILNSCEFGEDRALKNYEDALKDLAMNSAYYSIVSSQYARIKADHDRIKHLRDTLVER